MRLATWLALRLGSRVEYPGGVGGQCVDLCNDYLSAVLGKSPVRANAADWAKVYVPGLRFVANAPDNAPLPGDVVIWRANTPMEGIGAYGHCAVTVLADSSFVLSLDQDWYGVKLAQLTVHSYVGVAGWLQAVKVNLRP